jgi:hypothetical protein
MIIFTIHSFKAALKNRSLTLTEEEALIKSR